MFERTARIDRSGDGVISGILATDGEATDGHILSIEGARLTEGMPLLFGHDDFSGRNNLGSWTGFEFGAHEIRGVAQIETGGKGEQAQFRQDVAHMVERGHIGAFSVRWDPIGDPVPRRDLPNDHPAHVGRDTKGPARHGLFFPEWRALEGSVVTIGADPAALMGRIRKRKGGCRRMWRDAFEEMFAYGQVDGDLGEAHAELAAAVARLRALGVSDIGTQLRLAGESTDVLDMVVVEHEGRKALVPYWAVSQIQGDANTQLRLALDLQVDGDRWDDALIEAEADDVDMPVARAEPEQGEVAAPEPSEPNHELAEGMQRILDEAAQRMEARATRMLSQARKGRL